MASNCVFCTSGDKGRYSCPKCNAVYCSLKCYRSPSHLECAEKFYKDCVREEFELRHAEDKDAPEQKEKMMKILERIRNSEIEEESDEENLDSDDELELAERLEGIDLDDSDRVWDRLTLEEKREFEKLAESGDIEKIVPEFQPWWVEKEGNKKKLVVEVGKEDEEKIGDKIPNINEKVPTFKAIMGNKEPSPVLKFGLLNVLYAYAYAVKFFLGDQLENPEKLVRLILDLSDNLNPKKSANFDSADSALESAASKVNVVNRWAISPKMTRETKKDVYLIVKGPGNQIEKNSFILASLSDLKSCFAKCVKQLKQTKTSNAIQGLKPDLPTWQRPQHNEEESLDLSELKKCVKKIEFYMSWTCDYSHEYDLLR